MTKPHDIPANVGLEERVSDRIRNRLLQAGKRFHANDNIADFVESEKSCRRSRVRSTRSICKACSKAW